MEEVQVTIKELSRGYRFIVGNHFDRCIRGDFYPNVSECLQAGLSQIVHKAKVLPIIKYDLK